MKTKSGSELDRIGNTPLVKIEGVWVKLEYTNPSGSIKDRMAQYIVDMAEKTKQLKKGGTIVEATSGNTGIAFSLQASIRGYNMIAVIPHGLSSERLQIMKAYGTKIIHPKHDCFICAIELANSFGKRRGYFLPQQFKNKWNADENEKILGKEILAQIKPDAFVAGVGTGGTVVGVGRALKKKNPKAHIVALEPSECALMTKYGIGKMNYMLDRATCEKHGIEGIGDGIIPDIVKDNRDVIDEVVTIDTQHAIKAARKLASLGYFVGPSSGANFLAAQKLRKKYKNVLTVFPDSGDRYLSEKIFE